MMLQIRVKTVNISKKGLMQFDKLPLSRVRQMYGNSWHEMVLGRVKAQAIFGSRHYGADAEFLLLQDNEGNSAFLMHAYNKQVAAELWDIIII